MSAPSANFVGVLPRMDASSVPVPTQSDQDMSEVHGPIIRPAGLRTGISSSPLWSPTSIAPEDGEYSASGSRRHDPTGTYGLLLLQQNNLANVAVVHQHGLPLETIGYAESRHRQILDNTQQRHLEHLKEVPAQNYNELQQMRIALSITQSDCFRLESSAAGVTNAQAEELASLRNQSSEEISVPWQKLNCAQQHADSEVKYRARLEAESASFRARTEQLVQPFHIGTPPRLPDTNRESAASDRAWMPPIPLEGVASLAPNQVDPNQGGGPPGGEPPKRPDDDDDDDDDDDSDDDR